MIAPLWIFEPDPALRPILTMALTGVSRVEIVEALPDEPPSVEALLLSLRSGEGWPLWAEEIPVVALIAKGDRRDWPSRWAILEKPFRPVGLRAAVVRMIETLPSREILPIAGGSLHLSWRRLIGPAGAAQLTEKETALLHRLLTARAPVSRAELLSRIWGYQSDTPTRTVETHVYRLRRKVETLGLPLVIDATGDGYRVRVL